MRLKEVYKCPICKEQFERNPYGNYKAKGKIFCSYKCYNEFLKRIEKKKWEKIKGDFEYYQPKQLKSSTLKKKYGKIY